MTTQPDELGQILASADTLHDFTGNRCSGDKLNLTKYQSNVAKALGDSAYSEDKVMEYFKKNSGIEAVDLDAYDGMPNTFSFIMKKGDTEWKKNLLDKLQTFYSVAETLYLCVDCQKHMIYDSDMIRTNQFTLLENVASAFDTASKDRKQSKPCLVKNVDAQHSDVNIVCNLYDIEDSAAQTQIKYEATQPSKQTLYFIHKGQKPILALTYDGNDVQPNYKDFLTVKNLCSGNTSQATPELLKVTPPVPVVLIKRSLDYTQVAFVKELVSLVDTGNPQKIMIVNKDLTLSSPKSPTFIFVTFDKLCFLKALYEGVPVLYEKPGLNYSTFYHYSPRVPSITPEKAEIYFKQYFEEVKAKYQSKKRNTQTALSYLGFEVNDPQLIAEKHQENAKILGRFQAGFDSLVAAFNENLHDTLYYQPELLTLDKFNSLDKKLIGTSSKTDRSPPGKGSRIVIHDVIPNTYIIGFANTLIPDITEDDFETMYYTVSMLIDLINSTSKVQRTSQRSTTAINYSQTEKLSTKEDNLRHKLEGLRKIVSKLNSLSDKLVAPKQILEVVPEELHFYLKLRKGNRINLKAYIKSIGVEIDAIANRIEGLEKKGAKARYRNIESLILQGFRQSKRDTAVDFLKYLRMNYIEEYLANIWNAVKLLGVTKKVNISSNTPETKDVPDEYNSLEELFKILEPVPGFAPSFHEGGSGGKEEAFEGTESDSDVDMSGSEDTDEEVPEAPAKPSEDTLELYMTYRDIILRYDKDDYEDLTENAYDHLEWVYEWARDPLSIDIEFGLMVSPQKESAMVDNEAVEEKTKQPQTTSLIQFYNTLLELTNNITLLNIGMIYNEYNELSASDMDYIKSELQLLKTEVDKLENLFFSTKRPRENVQQPYVHRVIRARTGGKSFLSNPKTSSRPKVLAQKTLSLIADLYKPKKKRTYHRIAVHTPRTRTLMAIRNINKLLKRLK